MNEKSVRQYSASSLTSFWRKQKRRRYLSIAGMIGAISCVFWIAIAIFGAMLAPHDPSQVISENVFGSISGPSPFGTDYLGRDVLSRVLNGARYTVGLALAAAILGSLIGTSFALMSVTAPRWLDAVVSQFMDALTSIPGKLIALIMVSAFGASTGLMIVTAILSFSPGCYRIVRSLAVNIYALEYIQVARIRGENRFYIALLEILPNIVNPILADLGLRFVFIVLLLSGMSFLGLGIQPPDADLGSLVRENIGGLSQGAPAVVIPALAIGTLTIGVNLLIDSISALNRARTGGH